MQLRSPRGGPCRYRRLVARLPRAMSGYCRRGVRTPGHYLWTAYEGAEPVEDLWLHVETKPDGPHAFGYGIEVRQELRRRGYGRAITAAAEQKCREMNVVSIGLTVFGPNKAAQNLYEDLGFEATVLQMRKHLSTA